MALCQRFLHHSLKRFHLSSTSGLQSAILSGASKDATVTANVIERQNIWPASDTDGNPFQHTPSFLAETKGNVEPTSIHVAEKGCSVKSSFLRQSYSENPLALLHITPSDFSNPPTTITCSQPSTNIDEYICPSRLRERFSNLVILDREPTSRDLSYKCPVSHPILDTVAPDTGKSEVVDPTPGPAVSKQAKQIMKIRHKKMKKHKLRKLRKRMYFLWKRQKAARKAKRMTIYNKELDDIRSTGEDFVAEEFVKEQLSKARRGGYYINVFESRSSV